MLSALKRIVPVALLAAALVAALPCTRLAAGSAAAERPPNFIVIFCDDMGYADIGPFGAKGYKTPNLDRMASEGMKFTSFCVARSVCSPSRAALLTGCYPVRVGVPGNFGPGSKTGLHPAEMTIAEVVKQKQYAAGMYGKWHLGHLPRFQPTSQGFDEWFGLPYSNDMWPYHPENGKRFRFPDLPLMENGKILNPKMLPKDQVHLTTSYNDRAVKFIEKNRERPFLLYLPHAMPHVPLFVKKENEGKSGGGLYGDVIGEIDTGVGRILDTLRRLELEKNTLVIFTSDNGPWLLYGDHAGSAGPLREGKATPFEGGFRVPCIMWWPGKIEAGSECSELASTIDILPTIAHLGGMDLPEKKIDGRNIWPLMSSKAGAKTPHEAFYYYSGSKLSGVRSGKWKLLFPQGFVQQKPPGKDGQPGTRATGRIPLSLFDLEKDVGEKLNVAAANPSVVRRLQGLAGEMRKKLGDTGMGGSEIRPVGR